MEKEQLDKLSQFIENNKGKRKFTQSVDLTVNFSGLDFSKTENRLNLEIKLPHGKGKDSKVILFADDRTMAGKAEAAGARVISSGEMATIANDKAKMAELLDFELIAQPALMPSIAKSLGQFLGPRNKMPKPVIGSDVGALIGGIGSSLFLRSKGKYLPTIHCQVGNEKMELTHISENVDEVVNALTKKLGKQHIKSAFVKLTMSEPLKII